MQGVPRADRRYSRLDRQGRRGVVKERTSWEDDPRAGRRRPARPAHKAPLARRSSWSCCSPGWGFPTCWSVRTRTRCTTSCSRDVRTDHPGRALVRLAGGLPHVGRDLGPLSLPHPVPVARDGPHSTQSLILELALYNVIAVVTGLLSERQVRARAALEAASRDLEHSIAPCARRRASCWSWKNSSAVPIDCAPWASWRRAWRMSCGIRWRASRGGRDPGPAEHDAGGPCGIRRGPQPRDRTSGSGHRRFPELPAAPKREGPQEVVMEELFRLRVSPARAADAEAEDSSRACRRSNLSP